MLDLVLLSDLADVPCAMTTDDRSEVTEAQLYAVRLENKKFFCTYKTVIKLCLFCCRFPRL